jgi:hypothetical protein
MQYNGHPGQGMPGSRISGMGRDRSLPQAFRDDSSQVIVIPGKECQIQNFRDGRDGSLPKACRDDSSQLIVIPGKECQIQNFRDGKR